MINFSPKAKIFFYILLIAATFAAGPLKWHFILLGIVIIPALRIKLAVLKKGLLPVVLFLFFTFLSNVFFETGRVVYEIYGVHITEEGIRSGGQLVLRLLILIIGAKVMTAATPAEDLLKGISGLLGPVGRFNMVKEFIATMSLTIVFLPVIYSEAQALYRETMKDAPQAAFADKLRLSASLLTPLFERSMKRARELSETVKQA